MASAIPQETSSAEIVREARARTGVPAVAAGLLAGGRVELAADGPVDVETPFRIASITKWFTALARGAPARPRGRRSSDRPERRAAASRTRPICDRTRGNRCPSRAAACWSYSNAGFVLAGRECAAGSRARSFCSCGAKSACSTPLGLEQTSFEEPDGAAPGHVQEGATGHAAIRARRLSGVSAGRRRALVDRRRPAPVRGVTSSAAQARSRGPAQRGARPRRRGPGRPLLPRLLEPDARPRAAAIAFDHEGSVGGYQSLLLLVPGGSRLRSPCSRTAGAAAA